jgi:hypothetical protein
MHGAAGEMQILGDLAARLPGADDEHRTLRQLRWVPIGGGVNLLDARRDALGDARDLRHMIP